MEIELIGALDYSKVRDIIGKHIEDEREIQEVLNQIQKVEKMRHSEIVSTAGRLSRFPGDVKEVLALSESKSCDANAKYVERVIGMGHKSIIDHDYLVFSLKNVSAFIEQTIIGERFSSFTIKSRRNVDFSNVGFYMPDFHNKDGRVIEDNALMQALYKNHMRELFSKYQTLTDLSINIEDARFILPYSYNSNIIMGIDAHVLFDMIIKYTKTKYSNVQELKELGDNLYDIAREYTSYLIPFIDAIPVNAVDEVSEYLNGQIEREPYTIIDKVKLLNSSRNIDEQILISAIMRRYQYNYDKALGFYEDACRKNPNFKRELMRAITFRGDSQELHTVNFEFQIPVSYAILTHLTRHRTHNPLIPDFFPNIDLMQYKIPPKIEDTCLRFYKQAYQENKDLYDTFKNAGVRDEDLIYFTLSGNMTNILTNIDGWSVRHILELRECNKSQWETRAIATGMHEEIKALEGAEEFSSILGPTCVTQRICNEGRESCGRIKELIMLDRK